MRKTIIHISDILLTVVLTAFLWSCREKEGPGEGQEQTKKQEADRQEIMKIEPVKASLANLEYKIIADSGFSAEQWKAINHAQPAEYQDVAGVMTFRGNSTRTGGTWGSRDIKSAKLKKVWSYHVRSDTGHWQGATGWTGQPAIVRWAPQVRRLMNLNPEMKNKENFTEVIQASLNGNIFFLDLLTGKESRPPLKLHAPAKGSVSVDPRGYPLLYTGQGLPTDKIGFRLINLIDQSVMYFKSGIDPHCYRRWGAFDGSALFNRLNDCFVLGGENGLLYMYKLNTVFEPGKSKFTVNPKALKYKYKTKGMVLSHLGIENSVAQYRNIVYFADNNGNLQAFDLQTLQPLWLAGTGDDTDASVTVEEEGNVPMLYCGCEVDKQGKEGMATVRKVNGFDGKTLWQKSYKCMSKALPYLIDGGMLSTNAVGKGDISNMVIFSISQYEIIGRGLLVALDKKTGNEIWKVILKAYAWSSPVLLSSESGKTYMVLCNSIGDVLLMDPKNGAVLDKLSLGYNIEATPAVFDNMIVVGSRGPYIYGIRVE